MIGKVKQKLNNLSDMEAFASLLIIMVVGFILSILILIMVNDNCVNGDKWESKYNGRNVEIEGLKKQNETLSNRNAYLEECIDAFDKESEAVRTKSSLNAYCITFGY